MKRYWVPTTVLFDPKEGDSADTHACVVLATDYDLLAAALERVQADNEERGGFIIAQLANLFNEGVAVGDRIDLEALNKRIFDKFDTLQATAGALKARVEELERKLEDERARGCPCLYIEPCQPRCTCRNILSSHGCLRCCRYGSREQQTEMAKWLTADDGARANIAEANQLLDMACQWIGRQPGEPKFTSEAELIRGYVEKYLKRLPDVSAEAREEKG